MHLIDVDLRWGVTEKDAQEGKALEICLDEIDTCRPYFLGLLGHRYGHVPPGHQHSITALEIYHGVLHNDIPKQVVDLSKIIEGKLEGRQLSDEQRDTLMRCYVWDAGKRKYMLREDITAGRVRHHPIGISAVCGIPERPQFLLFSQGVAHCHAGWYKSKRFL